MSRQQGPLFPHDAPRIPHMGRDAAFRFFDALEAGEGESKSLTLSEVGNIIAS